MRRFRSALMYYAKWLMQKYLSFQNDLWERQWKSQGGWDFGGYLRLEDYWTLFLEKYFLFLLEIFNFWTTFKFACQNLLIIYN